MALAFAADAELVVPELAPDEVFTREVAARKAEDRFDEDPLPLEAELLLVDEEVLVDATAVALLFAVATAPARPASPRLPRNCGAVSETASEAVVVPVRRNVSINAPRSTRAVRITGPAFSGCADPFCQYQTPPAATAISSVSQTQVRFGLDGPIFVGGTPRAGGGGAKGAAGTLIVWELYETLG